MEKLNLINFKPSKKIGDKLRCLFRKITTSVKKFLNVPICSRLPLVNKFELERDSGIQLDKSTINLKITNQQRVDYKSTTM
ncbi:CLUMA_CG009711, isoform A [Clunio marinus]|uniref:CLUMA_CG009711, isoform A n=1 Tax=Clunio marinus TaxID=568069 RepID=A0A1J1I7X4_9DIPT|nr:CLUMA_CG009711, isoform A [Clunio marinus]